MNKIYSVIATTLMVGFMASCSQQQPTAPAVAEEPAETHVLHAQDVEPLSPDSVIALLKQ